MRTAALVFSFLLSAISWPTSAFAQVARSLRLQAIASFPASPIIAPLSPSVVGLAVPAATPLSPSVLILAAPPLAPRALAVRAESALTLARDLPRLPLDAAPGAAAASFALLSGETFRREEGVLSAPSSPDTTPLPPSQPRRPDPEQAKNVRRMLLGTSAMKSGLETVTLSIPLLALQQHIGGASMIAALVVVYGVSQAVFAGAAGSLAKRFPEHRVLSRAVLAQAALVAIVFALGATHTLGAWTLLPLYGLIGGAVGIIETTRHSMASLILGRDEDVLTKYNARLHIYYEIAGVCGALAAGALLAISGPLWSLLIQPPAYIVASWFFARVQHDRPQRSVAVSGFDGIRDKIRAYVADIRAGAKIILGDGRLRWVALAFVLPQIVHRVFENLLIPLFAKTILSAPQASAWLLTASNLGELVGAVVLLRLAAHLKGPAALAKWGALGLLLIWSLSFSTHLAVLLPLILVSSLTWAASDLRLRSEVQRAVDTRDQPRAMSFLFGAFVLGSAAASFALGGFIDWMGLGRALYWICGGVTALAAAVFFASRRLKSMES